MNYALIQTKLAKKWKFKKTICINSCVKICRINNLSSFLSFIYIFILDVRFSFFTFRLLALMWCGGAWHQQVWAGHSLMWAWYLDREVSGPSSTMLPSGNVVTLIIVTQHCLLHAVFMWWAAMNWWCDIVPISKLVLGHSKNTPHCEV